METLPPLFLIVHNIMTHYKNVTKEVMEQLDEAERKWDRKTYEKIKQCYGIIDIYDLSE